METSALAVARANLDFVGTPYEESATADGAPTTIRIRPAGAGSTKETP